MRVLLDQGVPAPVRSALTATEIKTAYECGWSSLRNGDLLTAAETDGFDVFVTTDKNLRYQQNLAVRRIAVVVLSTTSWPIIQTALTSIDKAVSAATASSYVEVAIG